MFKCAYMYFKLVDGKVCVEQTTSALFRKVVEKDNIFECCDVIKSELDDLKSELKSCKKIIRILYEDVQIGKTTPSAVWDITNRDRVEEMQINSCARDEGWQNIANRRRKPQNTRGQLQQLPLHTSNQFTPLLNLKEDVEGPRYPRNGSCYKVLSNSMVKNDKREIVIIGDSHARNCAAELQRQLGRK